MATGVNAADYNQLAVRFTESDNDKLLGSGTLVAFQDSTKAVVLTAAHVIHERDKDHILLKVRLKDRTEKQICVQKIIEHTEYQHDKDGNKTSNDAAIILVQWEEWMVGLPFVKMEDPDLENHMVLWGFPGGEANEGMNGREMLRGTITDASADWWTKMEYIFPTGVPQRNRKAYMEGFSGSGVYQITDYMYVYGGAMSGGVGKDEAGNKAKITRASLFLDMLKEAGYLSEKPVDFPCYMKAYLEGIDENKKKAREFVRSTLSALRPKISEDTFLIEGQDRFATLPCFFDNHKRCSVYWDGQLSFLTASCGVLEINPEELKEMEILLPNEDDADQPVNVKVLCTEERIETCIRNMIQQGYFAGQDSIKNNTIFLWANQKHNAYSETFNRFSGRQMVNSIVDMDYTFGGLEDKFEGNESFDIVNGQLNNCNISVLGIGKIKHDVIANGKGKKENMASKLNELLREAWEEDEE